MVMMDRASLPNDLGLTRVDLHETEMTHLIRIIYGVSPKPLGHVYLASLDQNVFSDSGIKGQCN